MNEVFVIEKMVIEGFWELVSDVFFVSEKEATDKCLSYMDYMKNHNKPFCARVKKLEVFSSKR